MTPTDAAIASGAPTSTVNERSSYRGNLTWNADRTGLQIEHMFVGSHFNPEIGFLRRSAFRRSYGQARFSPRPSRWQSVRKLYTKPATTISRMRPAIPNRAKLRAPYRMELANGDQYRRRGPRATSKDLKRPSW